MSVGQFVHLTSQLSELSNSRSHRMDFYVILHWEVLLYQESSRLVKTGQK